jgi:hypothetical protein
MIKGVLSRLDHFEKVHKPRPKITQVWVRKNDTIHPLRGSGNEWSYQKLYSPIA